MEIIRGIKSALKDPLARPILCIPVIWAILITSWMFIPYIGKFILYSWPILGLIGAASVSVLLIKWKEKFNFAIIAGIIVLFFFGPIGIASVVSIGLYLLYIEEKYKRYAYYELRNMGRRP